MMFYIFLIFCNIPTENLKFSQSYYNNLKYLTNNCSISFERSTNEIYFNMIKLGKTDKDLNYEKNKDFLISKDKTKKYKNINTDVLYVFSYVDEKRLPIKKEGLPELIIDMRINGNLNSNNVDINLKDFQKYLFQNYALFLSINNVDLEKINIIFIK